MSLSTTGLILLSLISTFLHHLMERMVIWSVLPTTQVTVSPGGSSLRILKISSFVLAFEVPSELQQTSVLHHLQGREPHFLFPFLTLNNLKILCHLIPLMNQHPILSNLSTVITEVCHFGHFWLSCGRSAMSGSPMGRSEGST